MQDEIDVLRVHTWKDWVYTAKLDKIVKSYSINLQLLLQNYEAMYQFLKSNQVNLKLIFKSKFSQQTDKIITTNYEDRFYQYCLEANEHTKKFESVKRKLDVQEIRNILREYEKMREEERKEIGKV